MINREQRWVAEEYNKNSSVQWEAALQLLKYIKLNGNEHILDIGCGDGKISEIIASKLITGSVVGIDISNEMIAYSQKNSLKIATQI